jgi:4-hydroxy-tetrahydrodipicolinate synthase
MNLQSFDLWTVLITPLKESGQLDLMALKRLIQRQEEAQNAIVLLGSTSEALNLSLSEKKAVIECAFSEELTVPVMVGINGHDLDASFKWLDFLAGFSIAAYLAPTPHYARPGDHGQSQWFQAIMDKSSRPLMLYNVPSRSATELSLKAVENLSSHKNFWSIKDASGSVEKYKLYQRAAKKPIYCGDDALFFDFAQNGSIGIVSVIANVWPHETKRYVEECRRGHLLEKDLWLRACQLIFAATNPVAVKRLMFEEGLINSATLKLPLSADDYILNPELLKISQDIRKTYLESKK